MIVWRGGASSAPTRFGDLLRDHRKAVELTQELAERAGLSVGHTLADCLGWVGAIAEAENGPGEARRLFGAAEAQWQASG